MPREVMKTVENLVEHQKLVYLGSVGEDGYPGVKAMLAPRRREEMRVFYLTTNTSSRRVAQFRQNPKACLYFCDQRFFRGVALQGMVEVLEDAVHKEMIWQDGDIMYYPGGVTDPDYCVLRFTAEIGRFYSNFKSVDFLVEGEKEAR